MAKKTNALRSLTRKGWKDVRKSIIKYHGMTPELGTPPPPDRSYDDKKRENINSIRSEIEELNKKNKKVKNKGKDI